MTRTALDAAALLSVWEHGGAMPAPARAVSLLAAAWPGTAWGEESVGRRDEQLLTLREQLFGETLDAAAVCPDCGERMDLRFATHDVVGTTEPDLEALTVRVDSYEVRSRLPTTDDLLAVAGEDALLERCVESARRRGKPVAAGSLPDAVRAAVAEGMAKADPHADVQVAIACPGCGRECSLAFDITSYLWSEIDDWAQRLLADVHTLASAYGWREGDVLAMSARRRRAYLELQSA
jgi:hypothetical protein